MEMTNLARLRKWVEAGTDAQARTVKIRSDTNDNSWDLTVAVSKPVDFEVVLESTTGNNEPEVLDLIAGEAIERLGVIGEGVA